MVTILVALGALVVAVVCSVIVAPSAERPKSGAGLDYPWHNRT